MAVTINDNDSLIGRVLDLVTEGKIKINWRGNSHTSSPSDRTGRRRGGGREHYGFKVFDAAAGDDPERIDWTASAMHSERGVYIVRTFRQSPTTCLRIKVDVGPTMKMSSLGMAKNFLGLVLAACGIESVEGMGDLVSFVTYAEDVRTVLKPQSAKIIRMRALLAAIEDGQMQTVSDRRGVRSGKSDLESDASIEGGGGLALALTSEPSAERGIALIISDFSRLNSSDWAELSNFAARHDTIAVLIEDLRECQLPSVPFPGAHYRLEDCYGKTLSLWVLPDHLPRWLNFIVGLMPLSLSRLTPSWLRWIFQRVFGTATTRQKFADNFRRHEGKIIKQLEECGITTMIARTSEPEEAIEELLRTLASKQR